MRTEISTDSDEIEPMMVSQWWERKVTKKKHRKNFRSIPNDKKPNEQRINSDRTKDCVHMTRNQRIKESRIVSTWLEKKEQKINWDRT